MFLIIIVYMLEGGPIILKIVGKWAPLVFTLGLGFIPFLFALFAQFNIKEVFYLKLPRCTDLLGGLMLSAGLFLLVLFGSFLIVYLFPEFKQVGPNLRIDVSGYSFFLTIISIGLLPAICEEILFRGFIFSGLLTTCGKWFSILVCAILFGLMHFDPYRIPFTIAIGIGLSYAVWETQSIFVSILMHCTHNVALLFLMKKTSELPFLNSATQNPLFTKEFCVTLVISFLLILGGCTLLKRNNRLAFRN